jgi:hypothetical protein
MKIVTIRCEHTPKTIRLRVPETKLRCIQCGLIQINLSAAQALRVHRFCHCMPPQMDCENPNRKDRTVIAVDPSQVDMKGEFLNSWLIG